MKTNHILPITVKNGRVQSLAISLIAAMLMLWAFIAAVRPVMPAQAAPNGTTIIVNTADDELNSDSDCSLREAIQAANTDTAVDACPAGSGADGIAFAANYTITLGSALPVITSSVTITGNGTVNTIVQASTCDPVNLPGGCTPATWRVFTIDGSTVTLKDLTTRYGVEDGGNIRIENANLTLDAVNVHYGYGDNYGGGLYVVDSDLTIQNGSSVDHNKSRSDGGGIYTENFGGQAQITINNSAVNTNTTTSAAGYGGGIFVDADDLTILIENGSQINNNTAQTNGGGIEINGGDNISLTVNASSISNNQALTGYGGGIRFLAASASTLTIQNGSLIDNNTAGDGGGGIFFNNGGTLTVDNSQVSYNHSDGYGGGIDNRGSTVNIQNGSRIEYNTALGDFGGGINSESVGCEVNVDASTIANNSAVNGASDGGGLYSFNCSNTISNSTFSANQADRNGGGMYLGNGTTTVTNSTFSGNSATDGGGMYLSNGATTVSNSTFSSNSATTNGGGIYKFYGSLSVLNSTVSGNSATSGAGIYGDESGLTLKNTILANSTSGTDCFSNAPLTADTNNLIENNSGCGTPISTADPKLGPLGNNGGDTQTHALPPDSPALDAGDNATCTTADQRGIGRPQGDTCDIGAYESTYSPLAIVADGSGSGTVTANPDQSSYAYGTEVTVTAVADDNSTFTGWSGDCTNTTDTCVVTMSQARAVTATFAKIYQLYLPVIVKP